MLQMASIQNVPEFELPVQPTQAFLNSVVRGAAHSGPSKR
jgi:hypothetical protein